MAPFYLAGGSAAALHLGHRISVDLDFFTPQSGYDIDFLVRCLQTLGHLSIQQQTRGSLNSLLNEVRVSFFTYPYPLLQPLIQAESIAFASLLDIALMKLIAISQRGKKRDFIDLYFICQSAFSLDELLPLTTQKYTIISYPSYHLLRALVYFEDAEDDEQPTMLVPFDWKQTKRFFEHEVRRLLPNPSAPLRTSLQSPP